MPVTFILLFPFLLTSAILDMIFLLLVNCAVPDGKAPPAPTVTITLSSFSTVTRPCPISCFKATFNDSSVRSAFS